MPCCRLAVRTERGSEASSCASVVVGGEARRAGPGGAGQGWAGREGGSESQWAAADLRHPGPEKYHEHRRHPKGIGHWRHNS
jgi:hypothetical protein